MKILFFASIAEIVGTTELEIPGIQNMKELKQFLASKYPTTTSVKYTVAVNKVIVHNENHIFSESDSVAILPPFSGG